MKRFLCLLLLLGPLYGAGCSEPARSPGVGSAPDVVILYPPNQPLSNKHIADSSDVLIAVLTHGPSGQPAPSLRSLQGMFSRPDSVVKRQAGKPAVPVTVASDSVIVIPTVGNYTLPADARTYVTPPTGYTLYWTKWYTILRDGLPPGYPDFPIDSGVSVQLFAVALDQAGNQGVSASVPLAIYNTAQNLVPPVARFTVTPNSGTVETVFSFNPDSTSDVIDHPDKIRVRWSWNSGVDSTWNVPWGDPNNPSVPDSGKTAVDVLTHRFASAGTYRVLMEAKNTYLPGRYGSSYRLVVVRPRGGTPRPPDSLNFVTVPPGTYTTGDSVYTLDGIVYHSPSNEVPMHGSTLSQNLLIEKTEVTNLLYLNFIDQALALDTLLVLKNTVIWSKDVAGEEFLDLTVSQIKWDLDTRRFTIADSLNQWNNPVVGVTWYGADAYAGFYATRLPTEAEWEAAGRGHHPEYSYPMVNPDGSEGYPGGVDLPIEDAPLRVNYYHGVNTAITTPVGHFDGTDGTIRTVSPFGLFDLAGNAAEWVSDWYGLYQSGNQIDPTGPESGTLRVVRGGSFESSRADVRVTARTAVDPSQPYPTVGFRVAFTR